MLCTRVRSNNLLALTQFETLHTDCHHTLSLLHSAASKASCISTRLAARLGIEKGERGYEVAGFRTWNGVVYLPSKPVLIECRDMYFNLAPETAVDDGLPANVVKLAILIRDEPFNELVIGSDWLNALNFKTFGNTMYTKVRTT